MNHRNPRNTARQSRTLAAPFANAYALRAGTGRAPLWLRLRRSVLQLFRILARREDFTVARPASSARHHFVPADFLAPNSPAQFGRTHQPLHPVLHAGRLPCDCGALPSAPSLSAFLPISAVFHSAPPRSERFLKTPQRSERTQRGKGRQRVPRTHCGGCQSLASTLAAPRAPLSLRPRRSVLQLFRILARREDFSRSAAVCAEHQPQQVGRKGRR